ncbi:hypothetical protein ACQZV8_08145 [Magnetococcales bacterium HHB-1]
MKKILAGALLAYIIPILLIIFTLMAMPKLRHSLFLFIPEAPGIVNHYIVRKHLKYRQFEQINNALNRQMDLMVWLLPKGKSTLLPGLLKNTQFAAEQARFSNEWQAILPFLQRLAAHHKEVLSVYLWLAEGWIATNQPQKAFDALKKAQRLAGTDTRIYRLAIAAAIKSQDNTQLKKWCKDYQNQQLGGPSPHPEYYTLFRGSGLRKMALNIIDHQEQQTLVGHRGLQLGETFRAYHFALKEPQSIKRLQLYLGVVPGVMITIHQIDLLFEGKTERFSKEQLNFHSRDGYMTDPNTTLTTSAFDGERITIRLKSENNNTVIADQVVLHMRFLRAPLNSDAVCTP